MSTTKTQDLYLAVYCATPDKQWCTPWSAHLECPWTTIAEQRHDVYASGASIPAGAAANLERLLSRQCAASHVAWHELCCCLAVGRRCLCLAVNSAVASELQHCMLCCRCAPRAAPDLQIDTLVCCRYKLPYVLSPALIFQSTCRACHDQSNSHSGMVIDKLG